MSSLIGFSYVPPARFGEPTHCELTYMGEVYRIRMETIYEMARILNEYPEEIRSFVTDWCDRLSRPD